MAMKNGVWLVVVIAVLTTVPVSIARAGEVQQKLVPAEQALLSLRHGQFDNAQGWLRDDPALGPVAAEVRAAREAALAARVRQAEASAGRARQAAEAGIVVEAVEALARAAGDAQDPAAPRRDAWADKLFADAAAAAQAADGSRSWIESLRIYL